MNIEQKSQAKVWLALGFLVLLALGVRLPGLSDGTVTHPEFYTPGIEFPDYVRHPKPRAEFLDIIPSVYAVSDIHPPGFHFVVWNWTKVFGTSHLAIRLPSVLIGTATVLMLFLLGLRTSGFWVALAAACILGLHGVHINKSVQSEIWIWPAFYALASTLLMLSYLDRPSLGRWLAYVLALTLGLWTEYSFWIFATSQILFVGLQATGQPRFRPLIEGQGLAVVLALPVLIYLHSDLLSGARAYLSQQPLDFLVRLLGFAGLVDQQLAIRLLGEGMASSLLLANGFLGGALLLLGLSQASLSTAVRTSGRDGADDRWQVPAYIGICAAAVATSLLALHAWALPIGWKIPAVLLVLAWGAGLGIRPLARRIWPLCTGIARLVQRSPGVAHFLGDPLVFHTLVPLAAFFIVGSFTKILAPRVFLIVTPLLLLLMMRGLGRLAGAMPKSLAAAILVLVLALSVASALDEQGRLRSGREYQAVARGLEGRVEPGDLVVTCYGWYSAPLHYYLTPDRYNFIRAVDLQDNLSPDVNNVWVVVYGPSPEVEFAAYEALLSSFEHVDGFLAHDVAVQGYRRNLRQAGPRSGVSPELCGQR